MPEYGITPNGVNIKRLDTILDDMHTNLSQRWGVNTRQNPESLLNHLLTNVADRIAELWEFGEDVYHSQYPSSAEGASLDNAAQYGGSTREAAARSYYPIHCTGTDGTKLTAGTMISSTTNPTTYLTLAFDREISRSSFNWACVKIASLSAGDAYTVALNGAVFSYTPQNAEVGTVLRGIAGAIKDDDFIVETDEENELLWIKAKDKASSNVMVLSENLTTESVTSILTFGTVDTGNILIPDGVITNIVKADAGLTEVINLCGYIAGREVETDTEFRQSYIDKIFNRSSMMLESIRSAILNNVQGAESVAPYENDSDFYDQYGRPPHSIEIVVDGGDPFEIAQQILDKKAGGINTYGDTSVVLAGAYDEDITIRFSRPTTMYTWFHLGITLSTTESIPENYVDLLRNVVLENIHGLDAGKDVIPQQFMTQLYNACPGINYIDIRMFVTDDSAAVPSEYPIRSAVIAARQRAYTAETMIEVAIDS